MCTALIKAILFLILVHNPPQTSKSEGVKIIFLQNVIWCRHQVSRSAKKRFQNFSKLIIPIDREAKVKPKSCKNHILKINRHQVIQIWELSKIRTNNLLTRQIKWNIFWSTGQKLLKNWYEAKLQFGCLWKIYMMANMNKIQTRQNMRNGHKINDPTLWIEKWNVKIKCNSFKIDCNSKQGLLNATFEFESLR